MIYKNKLKALRERLGLPQRVLANIINIDYKTYSHYENEDVMIPLKHLNSICNYFDVSIDYIFDFTNVSQYENGNKEIDKNKSGQRIKEFRKENKLTQMELAKTLNTVHPVIANYENGKHLIALPFLYELCKKYKISADYLLGRIDKKIMFKD